MNKLIGSKWKLKKAMLGNEVGIVGYVFNQYNDFDDSSKLGIQIIFPNGQYDGFSVEEQKLYLEYVAAGDKYSSYQFRNVMDVWRDFQNGYWKFS